MYFDPPADLPPGPLHPVGARLRLKYEEGPLSVPLSAPLKEFAPTRRAALLTIAGAAAGSRVFAYGADFWNRKDPQEWSSDEVGQLMSKSPWAKEVSSSYTPPGGGGGGLDSSGGLGGRRTRPDSQPAQASRIYKGTVRWDSAKPVKDALKASVPAAFANHYVISVTGFPIAEIGGSRAHAQSDASRSMEDRLDDLKGLSYLQPKDKGALQPGIVLQPSGNFGTTILFGFSKELLNLTVEDREVTFATEFGRINLKVKFNLKDMVYRGELAV
jgi:hypothetical protein